MTPKQFKEITEWQEVTFPQGTAMSKIAHLQEEVNELYEALNDGNQNDIVKEFADCFILLFGAAKSEGLSFKNICKIIDAKMEINKARKWGKPDERGVVNHIK